MLETASFKRVSRSTIHLLNLMRLVVDAEDVRERPLPTIFARRFSIKEEDDVDRGSSRRKTKNCTDRDDDRGMWEEEDDEGSVECERGRQRDSGSSWVAPENGDKRCLSRLNLHGTAEKRQ
ncbi:hypothetical protein ACLOJK_037712, partial [Asimina triloba]